MLTWLSNLFLKKALVLAGVYLFGNHQNTETQAGWSTDAPGGWGGSQYFVSER